MTRLEQLAEEWAKEEGLACLVPLPGKGGITSHEGHHCDCQVTMAFAHGLRAGIDACLERMDRMVEGYYERHEHQHEHGVRGAQSFIRSTLLEQHKAPQPPVDEL